MEDIELHPMHSQLLVECERKQYIPDELSFLWNQFQTYMDNYFMVTYDTLEKELEKNTLMIQLMKSKTAEIKEWITSSLKTKRYSVLLRYKRYKEENYDYFFEAWCIMHVNEMNSI